MRGCAGTTDDDEGFGPGHVWPLRDRLLQVLVPLPCYPCPVLCTAYCTTRTLYSVSSLSPLAMQCPIMRPACYAISGTLVAPPYRATDSLRHVRSSHMAHVPTTVVLPTCYAMSGTYIWSIVLPGLSLRSTVRSSRSLVLPPTILRLCYAMSELFALKSHPRYLATLLLCPFRSKKCPFRDLPTFCYE